MMNWKNVCNLIGNRLPRKEKKQWKKIVKQLTNQATIVWLKQ